MPSVFICHASEDKHAVEPIALALTNAGCQVFYDEQSLPAGGDYQGRIEAAIAHCDVFVFVASPASTAPERFTLSELKFARQRWPSPIDHVLPVAIGGIAASALPAYLQSVTIFTASGNLAAEVRNEVMGMLGRQRGKSRRWMPAAVLAVAALGVGGFAWQRMAGGPAPKPDAPVVNPDKPVTPVGPPASGGGGVLPAPPAPASKVVPSDDGAASRPLPVPVTHADPRPTPAPKPPPGPHYVNALQEAQVLLKGLNYNVGRTDGIAGPNIGNIIEIFQRKNRLPVTGQPDEATLEALRAKAAARKAAS